MKFTRIILLPLFFLVPDFGKAQSTIVEANSLLDAAQLTFTRFAEQYNADEGIRNLMLNYSGGTTDSLRSPLKYG